MKYKHLLDEDYILEIGLRDRINEVIKDYQKPENQNPGHFIKLMITPYIPRQERPAYAEYMYRFMGVSQVDDIVEAHVVMYETIIALHSQRVKFINELVLITMKHMGA